MANDPTTADLSDENEDAYALDEALVQAIQDAVEASKADALVALVDNMHAADIADVLEQFDEATRQHAVTLLGKEFDGDLLTELDESIREDVIDTLAPDVLSDAVRELESDDVVDLIEDLAGSQQQAILGALESTERAAVESSLAWPESSAGRLMQRDVVSVPEHWNVGQAIDHMRASDELPEDFYHVILVDARFHPVSYVKLGHLMASARDIRLIDITDDGFRTIPADQDEEDVAYAFNQYHLISAPVVDDDDRLVGVITIDDAMIVLDEEHEEDILRLAGVGDESLADRTLQIVRRRFPWLFVNLVTAILASLVIAQFEATIAAIVALAVLMPIVASMGGNAGTQTMTVAVRALATRDLTRANAMRVIRREVVAGLLNGVIFAVVMGVIGVIWFGTPMLGVVIGVAMVVNLVVAGLAGVLIPLVLDRLGIDPALASGAFVTTVTDVVGFFAFLGLAAVLLL